MTQKFSLINSDSQKVYGDVTFNGMFVFDLKSDIDVEYWNRIGFIKLPENQRHIESSDLFEHLNSRLPIPLRDETNEAKLSYIKNSGLRVASDNFYMAPAEE